MTQKKVTTQDTRSFFEELAKRGYEPLMHRVTGTYDFDIAGAGHWLVHVDAGKLHVSEIHPGSHRKGTPDCTIACSANEFGEVLQGKQDLVTAFMQGRMQVSGSVAMGVGFQRIIGAAPVAPAH